MIAINARPSKRDSRITRLSALVTLLGVLGAVSACTPPVPDGAQAPPVQASAPLAVEVMVVGSGKLVGAVTGSGLLRGVREATIVAEVAGTIESVAIDLGQSVRADQPLVRFDTAIAELNVAQARATAQSATIELDATERRFEAGNASNVELNRARSTAEGARAAVEAALSALGDLTPKAPFAGRVAALEPQISVGNYVQPGTPIARVVDLSELRLDIAVSEEELRFIAVGAAATVTVAACGPQPRSASVRNIAAGADARTGSFRVVVGWTNRCAMARSGMSATASIEPTRAAYADLVLPASAIQRRDHTTFVLVEESGVARVREVIVVDQLGERVVIGQGVSTGERVILTALSRLGELSPVTPNLVDPWRGTPQ